MAVLGWLLLALPCVPPALAWAALSQRLRAYEEREELRRTAKERRAIAEGMERAWRAMCRSGITVDRAAVDDIVRQTGVVEFHATSRRSSRGGGTW